MLSNLDEMIVVLALSLPAFVAARPICLRFMKEADFARRRNVWLALTVASLLSPSFWGYALLAVPFIVWCARKEPNPLALYVIGITVVPPLVNFDIPAVIINSLFRLDSLRVLAFAILVPAAWRFLHAKENPDARRLSATDLWILAYVGVVILSLTRSESLTHTMRVGFLMSIDILLPYFVASRICTSRHDLAEVMACFVLACAVMAPLAVLESLKGWLLYHNISVNWGFPTLNAYEYRAGLLRAQVSTGHSLALGNMMAIAFGFWLYLSSRVQSRPITVAVALAMWAGLIAASSRGPWLAAGAILFASLALGPKGSSRLFAALLASAVVAGLVIASPIGGEVIDRLPFVGTVGERNVSYRQLLIALSWEQIRMHPLFGNPYVLVNLQALRQGEGIIDLLNNYVTVTLFHGLAALLPYVAFFVSAMWKANRSLKTGAGLDADMSALGACLVACMFGFLLMMGMGGVGPGVEKLLFVLAGLTASYARLGPEARYSSARETREPRLQYR